MSMDAARACFARMHDEPAFFDAIANAGSKAGSRLAAQGSGFEFSAEEWHQILRENDATAPRHWFGAVGRAACFFPNECKA